MFTLDASARPWTRYLHHKSDLGDLALSSDEITTRLKGRAGEGIAQIAEDRKPPEIAYTIGSSIVFPGRRVNHNPTINGARGFTRRSRTALT